jgi:hypothetical protein
VFLGATNVAAAVRSTAWLIAVAAAGCAHAQTDDPPRGFAFGGWHRARYEMVDPQFRSGLSNSDQALALQTSLDIRWRGEHVELVAEIMDARAERNDAGSFVSGAIVNTLEPIQAHVAWRAGGSTVRIGRMTPDLGKRRLLARNRYRNTVNGFTGVDWSWESGGRTLRTFYLLPMRILPIAADELLDDEYELDRATRGASLLGLYYETPSQADDSRIEIYALDYELDAPQDPILSADHLSLGLRAYRAPQLGRFGYEIEAVLQGGDSGGAPGGAPRADLRHDAYLVHAEIGYAFDAPWQPVVTWQYDVASGDDDPTDDRIERFNTLFGARRFDFGPTGIYGIAARSNIASPGIRLTFRPAPRWQGLVGYRDLDLAAARDGWQGSGFRDVSGTAGRSIGRHLEMNFSWAAVENRLTVEAGFAKLSAARFAKQTAGGGFRGDPRYFYAALTTEF